MKRFRKFGYWYWAVMDGFLVLGVFGIAPEAFLAAIGLGVWQVGHYLVRERGRVDAFPVQVRLGYLGLLVLGQWEWGFFIYVIQLAGTTALLVFDYCPLARLLSLMPWNRREPLTARLVWRTVVRPPVPGSFLEPATR